MTATVLAAGPGTLMLGLAAPPWPSSRLGPSAISPAMATTNRPSATVTTSDDDLARGIADITVAPIRIVSSSVMPIASAESESPASSTRDTLIASSATAAMESSGSSSGSSSRSLIGSSAAWPSAPSAADSCSSGSCSSAAGRSSMVVLSVIS